MSATKWTPGPWEPDDGVLTDDMVAAMQENPTWIAVSGGDGHVAYCHEDNADLIAAAPEMAEALEAMLFGCRHLGGPSGDVLAAARAALAKARGES